MGITDVSALPFLLKPAFQATVDLEVLHSGPLVDYVIWESPDIIGFQEVLWHQYQDLRGHFIEVYNSTIAGRIDGGQVGEGCPIFWNK